MNPPELFESQPSDRALVDSDATLQCRLKAEPSSFNPVLMFTAIDAEFDYLLWDRPFLLDENLQWSVNPEMVEAFAFGEDHLEATLTLKPGLRWQDGTALTSADIVFSWSRILHGKVLARKARHGTDEITHCRAVDERRVQFKFKEALATNKWSVDFPIVPRHVYEPLLADDPSMQRSDAAVKANRMPVGNGPYRVVEWLSAERIVLERWEAYSGKKPAFARIIFRVIPDNNAALLAFEAGRIDEMSLAPRQFAADTNSARFAKVGVKAKGEQWTTYYIGWNVGGKNAFLTDAKVRRALGLMVNGELINKQVFFGLFERSVGLFPAAFLPADVERLPPKFDPVRAGRLLDEAGWTISEVDGWRYKNRPVDAPNAASVPAEFKLNIVSASQTSPRVADIFQSDLRKIGVRMGVEVLEWSVFNERNLEHRFDAFLSAWTCGPDPDEARNLFHSDAKRGGRNYVAYENAAVDDLFDRGRRTVDSDARKKIYGDLERIILADAPYTFLVDAPTLWAFSHRVRGVTLSPRGPMHAFPGMRAWWTPRKPSPAN
ncbi:MAG: hypothetical protein GXP29_13895 [Planctomycetes bacterium]|nr:hypothetical protein [Planctomycetota bacterium]